MFAVSYIDENDKINLKRGFKSDAEVYRWVEAHDAIVPLKLLVWSDEIDCYSTFKKF